RREWFHNKDGFSYYSTDYYITTIATKMNSPPGKRNKCPATADTQKAC
ncbi:hypothetical protein K5549_021361, partial [Capra hircus]